MSEQDNERLEMMPGGAYFFRKQDGCDRHAARDSADAFDGRQSAGAHNIGCDTGIIRVGIYPAGFGLYRLKYLWSDTEHVGVLAQEVLEVMPYAVIRGNDGYLRVNFATLGI